MRLTRVIHPKADVRWGKALELAPDLVIQGETAEGEPIEMMGLAFVDPDGELHVFLMDEMARLDLLRELTGGVAVPKLAEIPGLIRA